jgi:hypothetical protein
MLVTTNETTYRDAASGELVARQRAQAIYY